MSRRAWWFGAAALVVLLSTAALGVAVAVVDPNTYKPQIVAAVQRATGRALTLGGPLRVSPSLWPTIEVTDVKLANLPGGTRPDMVRAERIEAQLSLPALLLRRRLELTKLTLVGPNILFERVEGQPNWVLEPGADPQAVPSGPPPRVALDIRMARVRNGMITLRLPARVHVIGIRSLNLRHLAAGGPLDLAAVLVYSDYQPFRLQATARPTGSGEAEPWDTRLEFAAYGATLSATGRASLAGDYDLRVEGRVPELERLNALLPTLRLPQLRGVSLSTHLTSGQGVPGDLPVVGRTQLQISNADLSDRVPGLTLSAVEATLPEAGSTAVASGTGRYAGRAFTFEGRFGVPERPDRRIDTPVRLEARMAPPAAMGKVAQAPRPADSDDGGNMALKGRLALDEGSFGGLEAAVELRLPAALGAWRPVLPPRVVPSSLPDLTDVSLAGQLSVPADLDSLQLHGARLSARELDVTGDTTIGLRPALALHGRLRATRLDVDALLAAAGTSRTTPDADSARTAAPAGGPVIPDTPLPWAILRGKTVDLAASVTAMTFRRQVWHDVDLALRLADSRLQVDRLRLTPPSGGTVGITLNADA
jgi:AsmA protein